MQRRAIDAMWWRLHTAYLRNRRKDAELFLGMLEDEASRAPLTAEISPLHYQRFLAIQSSIHSGVWVVSRPGWEAVVIDPQVTLTDDPPSEKEFHQRLSTAEGHTALLSCLNIDPTADIVHELDFGEYGRCDFVIREGRTFHAVEIKIGEAKPAVVSQVDRYRLALELDMVFGMHDEVIATVIAESFPSFVSSELARNGILPVLHVCGNPSTLKMIK